MIARLTVSLLLMSALPAFAAPTFAIDDARRLDRSAGRMSVQGGARIE